MKKNTAALITEIILLALCAVLCIGVKTFFSACDHMTEQNTYMPCHWAEQAVFAAAAALTVSALIVLLIPDPKAKAGAALGMIPLAVITMLIPNVFINLCMKTDMQCHAVMRPAVMIISGAAAVCACVCAVLNFRSGDK